MFKIIIGLFTGMILAGVLFMGPLSQISATAQPADTNLTETRTDNAEIYREALISPLQEAGNEIQDKDIDQFYQKLLQEYELDEASYEVAQAEPSSPLDVLPDIKNINRKAISLPLREAGKNIRDKEIARFYYELLKDAGWTIESD